MGGARGAASWRTVAIAPSSPLSGMRNNRVTGSAGSEHTDGRGPVDGTDGLVSGKRQHIAQRLSHVFIVVDDQNAFLGLD